MRTGNRGRFCRWTGRQKTGKGGIFLGKMPFCSLAPRSSREKSPRRAILPCMLENVPDKSPNRSLRPSSRMLPVTGFRLAGPVRCATWPGFGAFLCVSALWFAMLGGCSQSAAEAGGRIGVCDGQADLSSRPRGCRLQPHRDRGERREAGGAGARTALLPREDGEGRAGLDRREGGGDAGGFRRISRRWRRRTRTIRRWPRRWCATR